jgi:hypothetical protein
MSARTLIAAHLKDRLPAAYKVFPFITTPDRVQGTTVLVYTETVRRGVVHRSLGNDVIVWVLSGHEDPLKAENALDASLTATLAALDELDFTSWTEAVRMTFGESIPGYKITLPVATT